MKIPLSMTESELRVDYGETRDTTRFVKQSSSGCALGNSLEEAALHGIFEVLERDYPMLEADGYEVRLFDIITFGYGCRRVEGLSRVYELPYMMGYTSHSLTVDTLNEDCHPFA